MFQIFGFIAVLVQALAPWGALPPWAVESEKYRACLAQATAPELLRIEVLRVRHKFSWCPRSRHARCRARNSHGKVWRGQTLRVDAKVLTVAKSLFGVKPGAKIRFEYHLFRLCPGMVGPANRPQVQSVAKGDRVWVFLRHVDARRYALAAGAFSIASTRPAIKSVSQWKAQCKKRYPNRHR